MLDDKTGNIICDRCISGQGIYRLAKGRYRLLNKRFDKDELCEFCAQEADLTDADMEEEFVNGKEVRRKR